MPRDNARGQCQGTRTVPLTVALVTGVDPPLQGFSLSEFGQHFCEQALSLGHGDNPLLQGVVTLWELQGQVPKRLHRVGFVVARPAGDLRGHKDTAEGLESGHRDTKSRAAPKKGSVALVLAKKKKKFGTKSFVQRCLIVFFPGTETAPERGKRNGTDTLKP